MECLNIYYRFLADTLFYFPRFFAPLTAIIEVSLALHSTCTIIHMDGFVLATRFHRALAFGILPMQESMQLSCTVSGWFPHWQMYITFLRNPKKVITYFWCEWHVLKWKYILCYKKQFYRLGVSLSFKIIVLIISPVVVLKPPLRVHFCRVRV